MKKINHCVILKFYYLDTVWTDAGQQASRPKKLAFFLEGQNIAKTFHKCKLNHSLKMGEQILSLLIIKVHIFFTEKLYFLPISLFPGIPGIPGKFHFPSRLPGTGKKPGNQHLYVEYKKNPVDIEDQILEELENFDDF